MSLTFTGENFDVVGQPLVFYTFSTRSVRSGPAGVSCDRLLEIVCVSDGFREEEFVTVVWVLK